MHDPPEPPRSPGFKELITLLALMISLVALSIDAMLPALPAIGEDLGVRDPNHNQLVISFLFIGFALGQLFYGPISDTTGRKPPIYVGLGLFMLGCLLSLSAASLELMLAGRALQGFGLAGPRIVVLALVRDRYEGRAMARVMSFVMVIFILVPVLAPALGQGILMIASWEAIFVLFLALALVVTVWFSLRLPETHPPSRRVPFSLRRIAAAVREVCGIRVALGYTIATGMVFGAFLGFLSSVQQVLQHQYALGTLFALYFAVLASSLGAASYLNGRLVMRLGMRALTNAALAGLCTWSLAFFAVTLIAGGQPPLWQLMGYFLPAFFCIGILFGNLNALAMEPLGHIAGVGAAVIGTLSTAISIPLGTLVGQAYDGTVVPLIAGFAGLSAAAGAATWWAERGGGG